MSHKLFFLTIMTCVAFCGCRTTGVAKIQSSLITTRSAEIYATDISFDADTGIIKYTLPEPALVRIRIGLRDGGPLLRTLLDGEQRSAGAHTENWDGKDDSGRIDFRHRGGFMLVLIAVPDTGAQRKSPRFVVSFPDGQQQNEQQVPVVQGITPLRVTLDKNDKTWLARAKYEISVYIDNAFLIESEEGTDPLTYQFDTKLISNGVHTVTVNVVVYDGDIGTKSVAFSVNNKKDK